MDQVRVKNIKMFIKINKNIVFLLVYSLTYLCKLLLMFELIANTWG